MTQTNAFTPEISYQQLFQPQFNNVTDAYSSYGPGAFFVSLMNIVKGHVKASDTHLSLQSRRGDLWSLPITGDSINKEQPYLEKVIILLEGYLNDPKTWQNISKGASCFIPYSRPMAQIHTGLKTIDTELRTIAPQFDPKGYQSDAWVYAELGLSADDVTLLKSRTKSIPNSQLSNLTPKQLWHYLGITEKELELLIYSQEQPDNAEGLKALYINQAPANRQKNLSYDEDGKAFTNLKKGHVARIFNLVLLSRGTGWDYPTLNRILMGLSMKLQLKDSDLMELAQLSYLSRQWKSEPVTVLEKILGLQNAQSQLKQNKPSNQLILNAFVAMAQPLQLSLPVLMAYAQQNLTATNGLDFVFQLQQLSENLAPTKVTLEEALATVLGKWQLKDFKTWHTQLQGKMNATIATYQTQNSSSVLPPVPLKKLLFKQWTHELGVYLGLKDATIVHTLEGINQAHPIEGEIHLLNNFIQGGNHPNVQAFVESLYPFWLFLDKLQLSPIVLEFVGKDLIDVTPQIPSFNHIPTLVALTTAQGKINITVAVFDTDMVGSLTRLAALSATVPQTNQTAFAQLLEESNAGKFQTQTAALFDWSKTDVQSLYAIFKPQTLKAQTTLEVLHQLQACFALAATTELPIVSSNVVSLTALSQAATSTDWTTLTNAAQQMNKYIAALPKEKKGKWRSHYGHQLEGDRQHLLPVVLKKVQESYSDIDTNDLLSDYFLCDVSMAGNMNIDPLREAMDAVQTYLMRCKNGLEKVTYPKAIPSDWWSWIGNFRLWQAERKIQEHPVNYLSPTVRSTATDQFLKFQEALQQQHINKENVHDAFKRYLDDWVDLQNLDVVDGCGYLTEDADGKSLQNITLFGKSTSQENTYYYITQTTDEAGKQHWSQWKEVGTKIHAKYINSVYAFNRLHIFWTEHSEVTQTDPTVSNGKFTITSCSIKGIAQKMDGSWTQPKEITKFPFSLSTTDTRSEIAAAWGGGKQKVKDMFDPQQMWWNKLYLTPFNFLYQEQTEPLLFLMIGPFDKTPNIKNQIHFDIKEKIGNVQNSALNEFTVFMNTANKNLHANDSSQATSTCYLNFFAPTLLNQKLNQVLQSSKPFSIDDVPATPSNNKLMPYYYIDTNKNNQPNVDAWYYSNFIAEQYKYGVLAQPKKDTSVNFLFSNGLETPTSDIQFFAIRNIPVAFYLSFGAYHYLFQKPLTKDCFRQADLKTTTNYEPCFIEYRNALPSPSWTNYNITRISSTAAQGIQKLFLTKGLSSLFTVNTQTHSIGSTTAYHNLNCKHDYVNAPKIDSNGQVEFVGPTGMYAEELFFHAPLLIAHIYSQNLQFDAARKWFHHVFNPLGIAIGNKQKAWNYGPFATYIAPTSGSSDGEGIEVGGLIDPDTVAELHLEDYMQWTVRQYIEGLIAWGDNEFRQETWESLSAATQLYFEAEDLLGAMPSTKDVVSALSPTPRTYNKIGVSISNYFKTPTDIQLQLLWKTVQNRLYNLRHGLNIEGEVELPSEYGSPINPRLLVVAGQSGGVNPNDISQLQAPHPNYRFRERLPVTESLIATVVQFGNQLHSALEQKDSSQLQVLQATHQVNLENHLTQTYQSQIAEANANIDALTQQLAIVKAQHDFYEHLLQTGLISTEKQQLKSNNKAKDYQLNAAEYRTGAFVAHWLPTIFGMSDGGFNPGGALDSAATVLAELGQVAMTKGQTAQSMASYQRRAQEWTFQKEQAASNQKELAKSLAASKVRLQIAQQNLSQHQLSIRQATEIQTYLNNKFTNADFYHWMSGRMASLYFTAYQMALGSLHKLQNAFNYELDTTENFIPSNKWSSLHKGLLAGESLRLATARMHESYLQNNTRRLEVEKVFSLKKHVGNAAWTSFVGTSGGSLKFIINATDLGRATANVLKIHSISVSIPAVLGPYETFDASLKQTKALVKKGGTVDTSHQEEIVISRGINDMGIFASDMNDGRYLPFEGTGAVSNWTFTVDSSIAAKISDVIFTVQFTVK